MRSREIISDLSIKAFNGGSGEINIGTQAALLLEVALDIRDLLQKDEPASGLRPTHPDKSYGIACSFCLKHQDNCTKLVAGSCGAICDKCAPVAVQAIIETMAENATVPKGVQA